MNIIYSEQHNTFHLYNQNISYVIGLEFGTYLRHCYYGRRLNAYRESNRIYSYNRAFGATPQPEDQTFSLDSLMQEFPWRDQGDFRSPAVDLIAEEGDRVIRPVYESHRIFGGKPSLDGLPSLYTKSDQEAMTLEIILKEERLRVRFHLFYTIYRDFDVIARHAEAENYGDRPVQLERLLSMSMDIPEIEYELVTLGGSHCNEKNIYRRPVTSDKVVISSTRGTSSPQESPFIGLVRPATTEQEGEAIGISLLYSGNFYGCVQTEQFGTLRIQLGLNPEEFSWQLHSGERFMAPEAILVYSHKGLGEMSRIYHKIFRKRLIRGKYKEQVRPILLNSWEAMYFDLSKEKLLKLAKEAQELGIELLVMDDGWFSGRNTDATSLGDWAPDLKKFPDGLEPLIEEITQMGLQFGIWFEPEMISRKSQLYEKHPDWVIRSPYYEPTESRNQLVLDLSNPVVCEYVIDSVSAVLRKYKISYVKWDMNRHLTDMGSYYLKKENQRELSHRYVLGLYKILETLTTRFPNVLFESCSSGGGRFDGGMLYYMPQTWTSDNTDAVSRLKIQYGTSLQFPPVTMGSHVSASPNHQIGRCTPLQTRFGVALSGNLGYELNPTELSDDEKQIIKEEISLYKNLREAIQFGDFYRLVSPFDKNAAAWNFVSEDKNTVVFLHVQVLSQPAYNVPVIFLQGLDPDDLYQRQDTGEVFGGDELMYAGVTIPRKKEDFSAALIIYEKINKEEK